MSQFMTPQIILLREGTDTSQGKGQLISNINACQVVVDAVRTTLGPRGMDKLVVNNATTTISNDGATIMRLLDVVHPAAKTLVDIARSQDAEVGDGTTSVVVLAGELLKESKAFVEDGVHPRVIIKAYRTAMSLALQQLDKLAVRVDKRNERDLLIKCAATALNSKLIGGHKEFFARIAVDAVLTLDDALELSLIGVKKVMGGSMMDSLLIKGVAFKKTFSYAGFEQQPKKFVNPKIVLLNVELELKAEREQAEVRIESAADYQRIVDAEWAVIYDKLNKLHATGAKIILSSLPIGDLATQYFADRDMFCAGRVPKDDLARVAKATGGQVQSSVNDLVPEVLGTCGLFEERQIGGDRFNIFEECPKARTATVVLRGGAEQFIEEAHRSLHDAIMIVRRAIKNTDVVAGAGAIEMELSRFLRDYARQIPGKSQLLINAFAKALEVIPRQLTHNAGFDPTNVLNKLRQKHAEGGTWYGVDVNQEGILDAFEAFVWEPSIVRRNALTAATEAACLILSVDETVRNPSSKQGPTAAEQALSGRGGRGGRGRGRGRGRR